MLDTKVVGDSLKEQWNQFIESSPNGHIIQSYEWGQFRDSWGTPTTRIAVFEDDQIKAAVSFTLHKVPMLNKFVGYAGKGPVFEDEKYLEPLFAKIKEAARQKNVIFIKFEPNIPKIPNHPNYFSKNLTKSSKTIFASQTLELDLTKSEKDLLASFHPKWRYNIRLAEKKGVKTDIGVNENAIKMFLKLQRETAARDKFFIHPDSYYETLWKIFQPLGRAHIIFSFVESKPAAAWMLFNFGDYLYYPYGASSSEYRSYMPSHALMWASIKFGQEKKLKHFDLWGSANVIARSEATRQSQTVITDSSNVIAKQQALLTPAKAGIQENRSPIESRMTEVNNLGTSLDPSDPWAGFTRFKLGFNPTYKQFIGAYDLVLNKPLYYAFNASDKLRWFLLRLKAKLT